MPRGRKKQVAPPSDAQGLTKTEAVQRALAELGNDAKPLEIQKHIKDQFGIKMESQQISNYKSKMLKEAAGRGAIARKPPERVAAPVVSTTDRAGGFSLEELRAVKEVVDRIGADKVRQLAEALAK